MLIKRTSAVTFALFLTGCASVITDKTQPVKVETLDQEGNPILGSKCELQNDRGAFNVETPNTVFVRKSAGDMVVTCSAPGQAQADGKLISRTGGAVFGNIILGGVIGAVVDTASGVAYNYPEWIQLVFGKMLTFDRKNHTDAQPTVATVHDGVDPAVSVGASSGTNSLAGSSFPQQVEAPKVEHITIVVQPEAVATQ